MGRQSDKAAQMAVEGVRSGPSPRQYISALVRAGMAHCRRRGEWGSRAEAVLFGSVCLWVRGQVGWADTFSSAPVLGKRSSSRYFRSAFGAVVFPPLPAHVASRVNSEATQAFSVPQRRRRGRILNVTVSLFSCRVVHSSPSISVTLSSPMQIAAISPTSAVPFRPFPSSLCPSKVTSPPAASPWRGQRVLRPNPVPGPRRPLPPV